MKALYVHTTARREKKGDWKGLFGEIVNSNGRVLFWLADNMSTVYFDRIAGPDESGQVSRS